MHSNGVCLRSNETAAVTPAVEHMKLSVTELCVAHIMRTEPIKRLLSTQGDNTNVSEAASILLWRHNTLLKTISQCYP